jgi:polar amino acid transport system permease protein
MQLRPIVFTAIICFAAGLSVATFAGFREFLPGLLNGAVITIQITLGGAAIAVVMALAAAMGKMYGPGPVRWLAVAYIETFRGTSALVQLFWLYFVLPHFGVRLEPIPVAILALGLNVGAYGAEVIRGSVNAVPRGQWEATVALNMSRAMALRRIILPQAFIAMIPPWGNLFIELMKATSLVALISIHDLTFSTRLLNDRTFRTIELFTIALLIYLAISIIITVAMRTLEHFASRGLARGRRA